MDEKEELVKKALFSFVRKQVPTAQLRYRSFFFPFSCDKVHYLRSLAIFIKLDILGKLL